MKSDFWDKWAGLYDLSQRFNAHVYNEMIWECFDQVNVGDKVLDAACGTGAVAVELSQKAQNVVCLDLSTKMLKQTHAKAKKYEIDNLYFKTCDICRLPFKDACFDVTIAANVLHLIDEPQTVVRELCRVTKDGGKIILPTYLLGEASSGERLLKLYKRFGFSAKRYWTLEQYAELIESFNLGECEFKFSDGKIPMGMAIIKKGAV